jgi:drug/metabolite transporter (DMT)-like permease
MDFLRLPLISLIGFWWYAEALDFWLFVGALLILAGNLFNIRAEQKRG